MSQELWSKLPYDRLERIFGAGTTRAQVNTMDEKIRSKKIREYSYKVTNIANKRITRLEKTGYTSPAYNHWKDTTGGVKYGIRGKKNLDDVIMTIQEAERFNNMETSSLRGTNKFLTKIGERLELDVSDKLAIQRNSSKIFEVAGKLEEYMNSGSGGSAVGSDVIQRYVSNFIQQSEGGFNQDVDSLLEQLISHDIYKETNKKHRNALLEVIEGDEFLREFGDFLI